MDKKQKEETVDQFKKFLLYAGLEPDQFQECKLDIDKDNRKKLRVYLYCGIACMALIRCLSGGIPELSSSSMTYGIALMVMIGMLVLELIFSDRKGVFLLWEMYGFAALLYLLGMAIAMAAPHNLSVSFVAFLLAVPLMFTMRPVLQITNTLFFATVFIVLAVVHKTGSILVLDVIDTVIFSIVSCVISGYMMMTMYRDCWSNCQLRHYANYDALTNMRNRNAFELERESWQRRCVVSLACVYVDVNGLHERNNHFGHEKGDQMLQAVALELREVFGRDNCYRIGGDEFVAFALDVSEQVVLERVAEFEKMLEHKGYSVSVGAAVQQKDEMEMDDLTRLAEKRMYEAKEEYYRAGHYQGR